MKNQSGRTIAAAILLASVSAVALAQTQGGSAGTAGSNGTATQSAPPGGTQGNAPAPNPNSNPNPNPTSSPIVNPASTPIASPPANSITNRNTTPATTPSGIPITTPPNGVTGAQSAVPQSAASMNSLQLNAAGTKATTPQIFATLDPNHKGYLSTADVASNKFLTDNFTRCDTNADGRLSQPEVTLCMSGH